MVITLKTEIPIKHNTTAGEVAKELSLLPATAIVKIVQTQYYDQRDPGRSYIEATWTEQK